MAYVLGADTALADYRDRSTLEPGKRGGEPCIRGLRITVYDVLSYLGSGMSQEEVLADFPDLEREDLLAALQFAADEDADDRRALDERRGEPSVSFDEFAATSDPRSDLTG